MAILTFDLMYNASNSSSVLGTSVPSTGSGDAISPEVDVGLMRVWGLAKALDMLGKGLLKAYYIVKGWLTGQSVNTANPG
jgi:hypothetical protein